MAREYKKLELVDNFMFCKVFSSNFELSRHLLEMILERKIREVKAGDSESIIDITAGAKSIRLDVYLDDQAGTIYDLEMQTTAQRSLPKRVRYYQGIMDLNKLDKGQDYEQLPRSIIVFICTFDYYGKGLPVYRFTTRCRELPELEMGDDVERIFLNLKGDRTGLSPEMNTFFEYLTDHVVRDEFTADLDREVKRAREHHEWEVEYMNWRAYEMDIQIDRRHAVEQSLEQGLKQGREEGREEEREALANAIERLRSGDTAEQLVKEGFTDKTIEFALRLV